MNLKNRSIIILLILLFISCRGQEKSEKHKGEVKKERNYDKDSTLINFSSEKHEYNIFPDEVDPKSNQILSVNIQITNIKTNQIQNIEYNPEFWYYPQELTTHSFYQSKDSVIKTGFGVESYKNIVISDFNFDKREDFAITNSEGGNGGPSYNYYIQKEDGQFELDDNLTNKIRFFPVEINNEEKTLTISHPSGCCKQLTYKIQLQPDGEWEEIFYELKDME
ncbi:XAC2610-related protein [Sinomicrobium weinanense]|uniref:Lipoprotein n=1 Tax=Sinomicrobium weinanense TaxID=2842200 RepID=A0A926JVQ4_9FLAO|nr:hypothetical protein [Sinomicrobium weinanense]MBC9798194.1 hypothetical protein [Sinomicrobium weinanense]MBU3125480.1 hypothetical protein [Sinomicrobium weinanense]